MHDIHSILVNVSQNLSSDIFATRLLMVKNARRGSLYPSQQGKDQGKGGTHQDDVTKTSGREKQIHPVLNLIGLDVKARGDDASLVEPAIELNNDFPRTVVINDFKLSNIAFKSKKKVSVVCKKRWNKQRKL